jgi:hypothetical protein
MFFSSLVLLITQRNQIQVLTLIFLPDIEFYAEALHWLVILEVNYATPAYAASQDPVLSIQIFLSYPQAHLYDSLEYHTFIAIRLIQSEIFLLLFFLYLILLRFSKQFLNFQ